MELTVQAGDGLGRELYEWLVNDPEVAGSVTVSAVDDTAEGSMGAGFDLLNLVISSVIGLSGTGVAIASFVQQRKSSGAEPKVQVEVHGNVVVLGTDAEEVLLRLFQGELAERAETER